MSAGGVLRPDRSARKYRGSPQEAQGGNETSDAFPEKYTWSLGTTYATGTPIVETYQYFADRVSEYSGGAMQINVFPDSALGGENDEMQAVASDEQEFMGGGSGVF